MPKMTHWIRQFVLAASSMFALLIVVALLRGRALGSEWLEALVWSVVSGAIFTAANYRKARQNIACALCRDVPEK